MAIGLVLAGCLFISAGVQEDRIGYLDNGKIRLGVDLDLGGAITYLSKSGSDLNIVNSADWGREIQMSDYSGPVPFTPTGKQPRQDWAQLGWNPIQCGDCYGNRSKLLEYRNNGREIFVRCTPMQWPLNNEPGECVFECTIKLDGQAALVTARLKNDRSDHTLYDARGQELPAIYTNGPWYRLMSYTGEAPFTGDTLTQGPSKFPWNGFSASENWAALVDDDDFGLGVWEPGTFSISGGFFGTPGSGGPKDGQTGYLAPNSVDIIDWNIDFEYRYALMVGTLTDIRSYVYRHSPRPKPAAFRFRRSREHWRYEGAVDAGWPIRSGLTISTTAPEAHLVGPSTFWKADEGPQAVIDASFDTNCDRVALQWTRFDSPGFDDTKGVDLPFFADGKFHRLVVDLSGSPEYHGSITGVRLVVRSKPLSHGNVGLREVSFRHPNSDAN